MMNRKCLLPLLLLVLVLLTACGGRGDIKYAEELSGLSASLTETLAAFDTMELEDPASVAAAITAIDSAVPICNQIIELDAPSRFEDIHSDFSKGARCYSEGLQKYRQMLQLLNFNEVEGEDEDGDSDASDELYVNLSMEGSDLLMEGAEHFQNAFDKLKNELE